MKTLRPHRHKQLKFFITDNVEITTYRDEIASMEHPFFALKAGDTKTRKYKNGNIIITVESTGRGLATIFDKDIWIYSISKLREAMNHNLETNRTIAFTPYNFFINTNRDKSGRAYEDLKKALSRLSGTRIQTNIIFSEGDQETVDFGLVDNWRIIEKKRGYLESGMVEITLPQWLYQAVTKTKVLQISPDYFRIRKAIDRRLYEIARKHCGNQSKFILSLNKLYLKSGSSSTLKEFKRKLRLLISSNDLPDYALSYNTNTNNVIFKNRNLQIFRKRNFFNIKKVNNTSLNVKKFISSKHRNDFKKKTKFSRDINIVSTIDKIIPKGFRG